MSKVSTEALVTAVILANEKRYRQNQRANFHTDYAIQFIMETIHGQEGFADVEISPDTIISILTINDAVWNTQTRDRTKRIKIIASAMGTLLSKKASIQSQLKVLKTYDLETPAAIRERIGDAVADKAQEIADLMGVDVERIHIGVATPLSEFDDEFEDDDFDEDDDDSLPF